jgi:hypothetical protein
MSVSAVMGIFKGVVAPVSKFLGIYILEPIVLTAIEYPNGSAATLKLRLESKKHLKKAIIGAYNKTYGTDYEEEEIQHMSRYVEKQFAIPIKQTDDLTFVKTEDLILWSRNAPIPYRGIDLSPEGDLDLAKEVAEAINFIASLANKRPRPDPESHEELMIRLLAEHRDTSLLTYYHSFKSDPEQFQLYARKYISTNYRKAKKDEKND